MTTEELADEVAEPLVLLEPMVELEAPLVEAGPETKPLDIVELVEEELAATDGLEVAGTLEDTEAVVVTWLTYDEVKVSGQTVVDTGMTEVTTAVCEGSQRVHHEACNKNKPRWKSEPDSR